MGLAGVGWKGGEKMQTTVIEQQFFKKLIRLLKNMLSISKFFFEIYMTTREM